MESMQWSPYNRVRIIDFTQWSLYDRICIIEFTYRNLYNKVLDKNPIKRTMELAKSYNIIDTIKLA